MHFVIHISLYN